MAEERSGRETRTDLASNGAAPPPRPNVWWAPVVEFLTHTLAATCIFVIIALAAAGLNLLVHWMEQWGVSRWLVWLLTAGEAMLAVTDIILYGIFLVIAAMSAVRELRDALRRHPS